MESEQENLSTVEKQTAEWNNTFLNSWWTDVIPSSSLLCYKIGWDVCRRKNTWQHQCFIGLLATNSTVIQQKLQCYQILFFCLLKNAFYILVDCMTFVYMIIFCYATRQLIFFPGLSDMAYHEIGLFKACCNKIKNLAHNIILSWKKLVSHVWFWSNFETDKTFVHLFIYIKKEKT